MVTTAFINIYGKRVGAVAWDPNKGLASFEYDPQFKVDSTLIGYSEIVFSTLRQVLKVFILPVGRKEGSLSFVKLRNP